LHVIFNQKAMEENKRSISANALIYGLITGGVMVIFGLLLFILNQHLNRTISYITYLFLIAGMAWGTLAYRKKQLNGFISYGKAFTSCFLIGLFAGILAAIYTFIFATLIHPGFTQELLDQSREQILERTPEISEEQLDVAMNYTEKFTSPVMLMVFGLIIYTIVSAIISLIIAIFIRKEDKQSNPVV
jgi:ABC-type antimicrobial peptide transport system permease subunit